MLNMSKAANFIFFVLWNLQMWVEFALAAILCSWLGSLWIKLLLWGRWRKTVKWIIVDGHCCIWKVCSTSRVQWFCMCSAEQIGRSCHHAETGGVWGWGTFPSKRGTEDFEPRPTYHRITEYLKLEEAHEGLLSSPIPSSSQDYLKLSDMTKSGVQTELLAKTLPTTTWSYSGCKNCPCVLQHLKAAIDKPLLNLHKKATFVAYIYL